MSRPLAFLLLAAGVVSGAVPRIGGAQVPVRDGPVPLDKAAARAALADAVPLGEEELLRRIEELLPELEEARAAAEGAERRRAEELEARPRRPTEVVRVGPLRIVAPAEQAELAAELFGEVWSAYFEGVSGSPALGSHVFVFQWAWRRPEPLRVDPAVRGDAALERVELTRAWTRTRGAALRRVRESVWSVLRRDIPDESPLGRWVGRTDYPSSPRLARILIARGSDASEMNAACLAGGHEACRTTLGLSQPERLAPPEAPALVLLEAVRMGGEGAWPRLLERSAAEPLDALAGAAGADGDAVLVAWRERVLAERPEIHAGLGGKAARTLLWVLVLAGLAMRSTRWRLA